MTDAMALANRGLALKQNHNLPIEVMGWINEAATALRATAQPAVTTGAEPGNREVVAEALQNFWQGPSGRTWAECQEKLSPQAEWFRKLADVAIAALPAANTAGDVRGVLEAARDYIAFDTDLPEADLVLEKLNRALALPSLIVEPTEEQLEEWVQHLDWDTGLSMSDEVKQLRALFKRIALSTPTLAQAGDVRKIEVDIGAALEALQASPELADMMNAMVGGPALVEAQAEIERLTAEVERLSTPTPTPAVTQSPPDIRASQNTAERDPSVMPDLAGGEPAVREALLRAIDSPTIGEQIVEILMPRFAALYALASTPAVSGDVREALIVARAELRQHDSEYQHRTDPAIFAKIDVALSSAPAGGTGVSND